MMQKESARSAAIQAVIAIKVEIFKHKILYPLSWVGIISSAEASGSSAQMFSIDITTWQHVAIVGGAISSTLLCVKTLLEVKKLIKENKQKRGKK